MGVGISMLFVARLAYRLTVLYGTSAEPSTPQLMRSPLTMFLFGLLAGYYITYFIGILMRNKESRSNVPA